MLLLLFAAAGITALGFLLREDHQTAPVRAVVLISIDTCRADHLGCYGHARNTTPHIDALAREGILFRRAFTTVPLTLPAHCSMLTGTIPPAHGVRDNINYRLAPDHTTLAEILRDHGYTTGAVVGAFVLDTQFGLDQGFDTYDDHIGASRGDQVYVERPAEEVSRLARAWLKEHGDKQFFLFLHYYDPHDPYEPPEPFASSYADDLYAGEIAYTDQCIGEVLDELRHLGLYDSSLIIMTADHGEGFGEHIERGHGYFIYQETMHVPLIIKYPGCERGERTDETVSILDVVPTVLAALGIPDPRPAELRELSVSLTAECPLEDERRMYGESLLPTRYACNPLLGIVEYPWKYILTTRPELYDLAHDRGETANLVDDAPDIARRLQSDLQDLLARRNGATVGEHRTVLDEASRKRLESLGYVSGAPMSDPLDLDPARPDPKDLHAFYAKDQQAMRLLQAGRHSEATRLYQEMLTEQPGITRTHLPLGRIALAEGDPESAIDHFKAYLDTPDREKNEAALVVEREDHVAHTNLGIAYYQKGEFQQAIAHYEKALAVHPNYAEAHNNYAAALLAAGKVDKAIIHYEAARELRPEDPAIHENLGAALADQGRLEEAINRWNEALRLNPDLPEVHNRLALAKAGQGALDAAIEHWSAAVKLRPQWFEPRAHLGTALSRHGDLDGAIAQWSEAVRLRPDDVGMLNNLAWGLATSETLRNPARAVQLAERACELTEHKEPELLDTLATAYAAAERFSDAAKTARKALMLAREAGRETLAPHIRRRLEQYEEALH